MYRLPFLCLLLSTRVFCQAHIDWKAQFEAGATPDESVRSKARETGYAIVNQLCEAKPEFVATELPGAVEQLKSSNPEIKTQASGLFPVLNYCRRDTEQLFSGLYPAFVSLAQSDAPILARANAIRAIADSKPNVPTRFVAFFKQQVDTGNSALAEPAIYGLARLADREPEAAQSLHQILIKPGKPDFRLNVVASMESANVKSPLLIRDFNAILVVKDRSLTLAALRTIAHIGKLAVEDNQTQLHELASSEDPEIKAFAANLLKRLTM